MEGPKTKLRRMRLFSFFVDFGSLLFYLDLIVSVVNKPFVSNYTNLNDMQMYLYLFDNYKYIFKELISFGKDLEIRIRASCVQVPDHESGTVISKMQTELARNIC